MTEQDIKKGLAGVVVDDTAISKVIPETNSLLYRGYPVQELARNCSFEEVAYLLWHGELPNEAQLARVLRARGALRPSAAPLSSTVIDALPTNCAPDGRRAHRGQPYRRGRPRRPRTPRAEANLREGDCA